MSEAFIVEVDAAATAFVDGSLAHPLLGFVRDLTRYAATANEREARRALCSPFSGVPSVDARALCTATGERRSITDTIERERVPLAREGVAAARRFVRALADIERAYRAQGATAREHVETIRIAFAAAAELDSRERVTLTAVANLATRLDAARAPQTAWDAGALIDALETLGQSALAPPELPQTLAPLPALEAETPHVVRRRRSHFSASSLGTFAECERRWYYRYVCAAVEDRGSSASTYGSAFHWALERFHQEFPRPGGAEPAVLERKLDSYLATSFERYRSGFETNVEYELQRRRAKRTGRRYLSWFLESAARHPFTVIGTETSVQLELDGYTFIGYIDRLDRDDATGNITVVDYKTGSIAESARQYREHVAQFVEFQLPFYYWARRAAGDNVTRLSLIPLKEATRDVEPVELEVVPVAASPGYSDAAQGTIGIDELERARAKMIAIAAELADGPLEKFAVTDDPSACTYCAYKSACRARPLQREDRFGR